jgi:hypothetical protein
MFEGEYVVSFRQRTKVSVVFKELLGHVAIKGLPAALVGEEKILGESVGFVPGEGRVFVRTRALFGPGKRLLRQVGDHGSSQLPVNVHGHRIVGKLVRIDQTAGKLVVGVCREPVTVEELGFGIECFRIAFDQAINLGARRFRSSHRVGSSQG